MEFQGNKKKEEEKNVEQEEKNEIKEIDDFIKGVQIKKDQKRKIIEKVKTKKEF